MTRQKVFGWLHAGALAAAVTAIATGGAFVPGADVTPKLGVHRITIGPDARACTRSEVRSCTTRCGSTGDGVVGCMVKTVVADDGTGTMTQTCTCGNPNNYAAVPVGRKART